MFHNSFPKTMSLQFYFFKVHSVSNLEVVTSVLDLRPPSVVPQCEASNLKVLDSC